MFDVSVRKRTYDCSINGQFDKFDQRTLLGYKSASSRLYLLGYMLVDEGLLIVNIFSVAYRYIGLREVLGVLFRVI